MTAKKTAKQINGLKVAEVKLALAAKYTHLATTIKSKPRKVVYLHQAEKFRRQAADLKSINS